MSEAKKLLIAEPIDLERAIIDRLLNPCTPESEIIACPYCLKEVRETQLSCCGESSSHFQPAYKFSNGKIVLKEIK